VSSATQSASLVLTTTPPEELAAGLTSLLWPLRLVGVPTKEIGASDGSIIHAGSRLFCHLQPLPCMLA